MTAVHATAFINSNRDPKKHATPFELPMPWTEQGPSETATPEEIEQLQQQLAQRSAFRD
jgi:hypothetical protein